MVLIPAVDNELNSLNKLLDSTEATIDFISSNLNIAGSNANVFANSIFNTSNVTGMYNYLKSSSNVLIPIQVPPSNT